MENRPFDEQLRRLGSVEQGEQARAVGEQARAVGERPSLIINRPERADDESASAPGEQPVLWRWHVRRRPKAKG